MGKAKEYFIEQRREILNDEFSDPSAVIEMMAEYMLDGDVSSITDLISAYISSSSYKNVASFASKIEVDEFDLFRMLSHENDASLKIFFKAIEQIYSDAKAKEC